MSGIRSITRWIVLVALAAGLGAGGTASLAATIGDQVFIDNDGSPGTPPDGVYSPGGTPADSPLPNITVNLYNAGLTLLWSTNTGPLGTYSFTNLAAGTYIVRVDTTDTDLPASLIASVASRTNTVLIGDTVSSADFPFVAAIVKGTTKDAADVGQTMDYTFDTIYYGSSYITNLVVTDLIPTGLTVSSINAGGTLGSGTVTWSLGTNLAPVNGTSGSVVSPGSKVIRDDFDVQGYSNQDGTVDWSGNWTETGDGVASATAGQIQVSTSGTGSLTMQDNANGMTVDRGFSLSGANTATLIVGYTTILGAGDAPSIQISTNGGTTYSTLVTFSTTGTVVSNYVVNLASTFPLTSTMRLRFGMTASNTGGGPHSLSVDYVKLVYTMTGDTSTAARDNFAAQAYDNQDGGFPWSGIGWVESADGGSASGGSISLTADGTGDNSLRI